MNKTTRTLVDASWYVVCFLMIQTFCSAIGMLVWDDLVLNSTGLTVTLAASSLITIGLYWWRKWWIEDVEVLKNVSLQVYLAVCLFGIFCLLPSAGLLELMGVEADETQELIMLEIMKSPISIIVVALLVPIAEEIVFRGALLRLLLNYFKSKNQSGESEHKLPSAKSSDVKGVVISILISSVLFGLVHGNFAQFFHASLLGAFLGWLYYKTKSILPGVCLHLVNNALVFILVKVFPEFSEQPLIETFGGNYFHLVISIVLSLFVLAFLICYLQVHRHLFDAKNKR